MMINYNENRNEVTVTGCKDCPFVYLDFTNNYKMTEGYCQLLKKSIKDSHASGL